MSLAISREMLYNNWHRLKFSTHSKKRGAAHGSSTPCTIPPIMKRITRKQFEIVSFIRDFIARNGIPPTLYEIAERFSISASTAAAHVAALERKHVVERRKGTRRSILPTGAKRGKKARAPLLVPMYAKFSSYPDAPDSRCSIDPFLLPDDAASDDLFAFRSGVFGEQPPGVVPGDVLIVWTRPGELRPGMMVLGRPGDVPLCRTVKTARTPDPDTLGRVVAVLRSL